MKGGTAERQARSGSVARGAARADPARPAMRAVLGRTRHIHFVGIGGIGMSGIAELLVNQGYEVSGSDAARSEITDRLAALGVRIHEGHAPEHVAGANVIVVSSAIDPANPEVVEALRRRIPVIPRAEMLAELMRLKAGIAVAGAHGKTTTTSMIALVLEQAGLDPTAVIGGRLSAFGSNARLGRGEYMVAEADESDRSFLMLSPVFAVVTNIDHEHLENYGGIEELQAAFVEFANKVPFYGAAILCLDDPHTRAASPRIRRRIVSYGLESMDADVAGDLVELGAFSAHCRVRTRDAAGRRVEAGVLRLGVPGRHNLLNALAAVAVAGELGIAFDVVARALADFRGAERRFQRIGERAGVLVVDDYGHHPTEIAAVLVAARVGLRRRILVVFQPHRYTRTSQLLARFGPALAEADEVVLTEVYAAGEAPIEGATVEGLAAAVRASTARPVHVVKELADIPRFVSGLARPGDLVITLGAGSIGRVGPLILDALAREEDGTGYDAPGERAERGL